MGRFYSIDALSELAYNHTPYRYGYNNPIFWSDATGLYEIDANGNISVSDPDEIKRLYNYLNHNPSANYYSIAEFMSDADNGFSLELPEMVMTMEGGKVTGGGFAGMHSDVQKALDLISNFNGRVNVLGIDITSFAFDFFGAEESNLMAASAMTGYAGLHLSKTAGLLKTTAKNATGWANKAHALKAVKFTAVAGKSLGVAGALLTAGEDIYNGKFGIGTGVKVAIGVATTFLGPVGVAYAIIDLTVGVTTGTTLTDRIASGIENSVK